MEAFRDTSEATPGPLHFLHIQHSGFTLKQIQMAPGVRAANMAAEQDLDNTYPVLTYPLATPAHLD